MKYDMNLNLSSSGNHLKQSSLVMMTCSCHVFTNKLTMYSSQMNLSCYFQRNCKNFDFNCDRNARLFLYISNAISNFASIHLRFRIISFKMFMNLSIRNDMQNNRG